MRLLSGPDTNLGPHRTSPSTLLMAPTTAAKANAEADAAGIDATWVRVLCVRCAKLLADPEMVESGVCCEWTLLLTYARILIVS